MEAFVSNDNKNILYFDYPFYKKLNGNGAIVELTNSEALAQAVKIWLVSKKNERIRSRSGGVIYPYLGKIIVFMRKPIVFSAVITLLFILFLIPDKKKDEGE